MGSGRTPEGCWRGVGDPTPYVPGIPAEVPRARSLRSLFEAMVCCTRCDLAAGRTQVVLGVGPRDAKLVLIGEGPGAGEDREGRPFVGASGKLLDRVLAASGLERSELFITNIVACRPPQNRAPKPAEIRAHAPWLDAQLRLLAPRVVVTLGRTALTYFLPKAKITRIRGVPQEIAWGEETLLLLPTFHPAAALRNRELLPLLEADLAAVAAILRKD